MTLQIFAHIHCTLFSSFCLFGFVGRKLFYVRSRSVLNIVCSGIERRRVEFYLMNYFNVWNQINLTMNYICIGGSLTGEIDSKEKGKYCSVRSNYLMEALYTFGSKVCKMRTSTIITKNREEQDTRYLNSVRYNEDICTFKNHSLHTRKEKSASLKIMTYNVLSQTLLERHEYLYRNASPVTLKWQYRFPRLLKEILEHNPDILCLQEVEEVHLDYFNKLEDIGYSGVYKKRTGDKVDGCSIYFRTNMFSLVNESKVEYYRAGVKELNRDNVGLIVRLYWWAGNKHVTIANTHLLYNPRRIDVRLAQISVLLDQLNLLTKSGTANDLVFLTGDLNSQPSSKVVELLTHGMLTSSTTNECLLNPSLLSSHNFNFRSVHNLSSVDDTEATTFQDRWVTADYIFYSTTDPNLCLSSRLRLPLSKECKKVIRRLPNYASPSDHLPIVATFLLALD